MTNVKPEVEMHVELELDERRWPCQIGAKCRSLCLSRCKERWRWWWYGVKASVQRSDDWRRASGERLALTDDVTWGSPLRNPMPASVGVRANHMQRVT